MRRCLGERGNDGRSTLAPALLSGTFQRMKLGRSIRIYLEGGEVSGIRHAELVNWTGQALLCPRNRVAELAKWDLAARRPGVYFLVGAEQLTTRDVYVGESESVTERIGQQLKEEFWQEAIIVTSKDENLTKSHVKYLESRLVQEASKAGRYKLRNGNLPTQSGLPRADRDAMEEFLLNLPLLLGVLGHRVLDPITVPSVAPDDASAPGIAPSPTVQLSFTSKSVRATGTSTDEGFVVFKGSTAVVANASSLSPGWTAVKDELTANRKLVPSSAAGTLLDFTEDVLFGSSSAAASIICGYTISGPANWVDENGRTLKDIEAEAVVGGKS